MLKRRSFLGVAGAGLSLTSLGSSNAAAATNDPGFGYRHSVYFNFKDEVSPTQREAQVEKILKVSQLPMIKKIVFRKNIKPVPANAAPHSYFEWVMDEDFASKADHDIYQANPIHQTIVRHEFTPYQREYLVGDLDHPFFVVGPDPKRVAAPAKFRHHVLFNLRPDATPAQSDHLINSIKTVIARQPTVKSFLIGKNSWPEGSTFRYEWVCTADFASEEDHEAYQKYPAHLQETQSEFTPLRTELLVVDTTL